MSALCSGRKPQAENRSAPDAHIILLIPFGQYYAKELKQAVATHHQTHPSDKKLTLIDLGPSVAKSLAPKTASSAASTPTTAATPSSPPKSSRRCWGF